MIQIKHINIKPNHANMKLQGNEPFLVDSKCSAVFTHQISEIKQERAFYKNVSFVTIGSLNADNK